MNMRGVLFLLFLLFAGAGTLSAQDGAGWTTEIIGEGIKPAIAVDVNNAVHLAYLIEDFGGNLFYNTNASGSWQETIVTEGYFYGPVDIALSANGVPFIAYHDHQGENFDAALGDEVVATLENGSWTLLTVRDEGHDGWDNDIAIDAAGFWHTSSVDPAQFGSNSGIEYATNAFGRVVVEQIGSGPQPYEYTTSIAVRGDGVVGITYSDERNRDLVYAERSPGQNGAWTLTVVDGEGDAGRYSSLAFDRAGNPHMAYFRDDGGTSGTVRYARREGNGNWQVSDIGSLNNVVSGMVGARKITSVAIDGTGRVHVVFWRPGRRSCMPYRMTTARGHCKMLSTPVRRTWDSWLSLHWAEMADLTLPILSSRVRAR